MLNRRHLFGASAAAIAAAAVPVVASAAVPDVRAFEVEYQNMAPTLRPGLHSIVTKPVSGYDGRGIYAFNAEGKVVIYRVTRHEGGLRLLCDNFGFEEHKVTDGWFASRVLGKATGILIHLGRNEGELH